MIEGRPMKQLLSLIIAFCGLLLSTEAMAVVAQSCNNTDAQPHVETAINATPNGGVVEIPPGNCTWTRPLDSIGAPSTSVLANRYLTFQGQGSAVPYNVRRTKTEVLNELCGVGQTTYVCITDGVPTTSIIRNMFRWDTVSGGLSRITNMIFISSQPGEGGGNDGLMQIRGVSDRIRFDHSIVVTGPRTGLHFTGSGVGGVIDHVQFVLDAGWSFYALNGKGEYGDNTWNEAHSLGGTAGVLFFEDNIFNNYISTQKYCFDGWKGLRMTIRKNTMYNCTWANHGTESSGRIRGANQGETYNNTFFMDFGGTQFASGIGTRGGVNYFFNNTITMQNGTTLSIPITLETQRGSGSFPPWGQCNGSSVWDQNTVGESGWRCLDQEGVGQGDLISGPFGSQINATLGSATWPRQITQPTVIWGNTYNGATAGVQSAQVVIKENRDWAKDNASCSGASCTSGVGIGTTLPSSCTTHSLGAGPYFWKTDEGTWDLSNGGVADGRRYRCIANAWQVDYEPYRYPHPDASELSGSTSSSGLSGSITSTGNVRLQ